MTMNIISATRWTGPLSDEVRTTVDDHQVLTDVEHLLDKPERTADDVFTAANLLALILFRRRRGVEAEALCREERAAAIEAGAVDDRVHLARFALQAQVNLIRLWGYGDRADHALAELEQMERLTTPGLGARFDGLDLGADTAEAMREAGVPLSTFAKNAVIVEVCKILWRHRRYEALSEHAERLRAKWPLRRSTLHHAHEVPWMLGRETTAFGGEHWQRLRKDLRTLAVVSRLHMLAAEVDREGRAGQDADELVESVTGADLAHAQPGTRMKCEAHLADTLLRMGSQEEADRLLERVVANRETAGDGQVRRGAFERLGRKPDSAPGPSNDVIEELRLRVGLGLADVKRSRGRLVPP
ncbi:hypothetical protein L0U85_15040 [Glycomyces sp. L485]|uniref:hypothetical protein n=1 Tax=Glycomyces sp. L485 TaxID=2909235 RepID=UPI001F4A94B0|nr:hypothetical protein [Glycomyces sp. L485]MCH7232162.1 hypothetical protein [Glycomyces sp. L485]